MKDFDLPERNRGITCPIASRQHLRNTSLVPGGQVPDNLEILANPFSIFVCDMHQTVIEQSVGVSSEDEIGVPGSLEDNVSVVLFLYL